MYTLLQAITQDLNQEVIDAGGNRKKTVCPFHNDTDPSLVIYLETEKEPEHYHCFSCGAHGGVMNILKKAGNTHEEAERKVFGNMQGTPKSEDFARIKGIKIEFLKAQSIRDSKDGIVIPYFNEDYVEEFTKVRSAYFGKAKYFYPVTPKTIPYGLHWLKSYDTALPLYIVEGETDALTLRMAGYQVLGIPSASIPVERFQQYVEGFDVIVVKDNDIAGWRFAKQVNNKVILLPRNQKDINNWFNHGFVCNIDTFKKVFSELTPYYVSVEKFLENVENHKELLQKKEQMSILADELTNEITKDLFINEVSERCGVGKKAVKKVLESSVAEHKEYTETFSKLYEVNNSYYKTVMVNGSAVEKQVSNFVVRPKYELDKTGDRVRVLHLINNKNFTSGEVSLSPDDLVNLQKFNTKIIALGNYMFTGNADDFSHLVQKIIEADLSVLYTPEFTGFTDDGWILGNIGISKDGEVTEVKDNVLKLGKKSFVITEEQQKNLPNLKIIDIDVPKVKRETIDNFKAAFGTYGAWTTLGWAVSGLFSKAIFEKYRCFPHLFIAGKRGSGKTTLAEKIMAGLGFDKTTCSHSITSNTKFSMTKLLGYSAALPQWFDDFRNEQNQYNTKTQILLDAYNQNTTSKGTKDGSLRHDRLRGHMLITGEDTPVDNAALTRCEVVELSEAERCNDNRETLDKITDMEVEFQNLMLNAFKHTLDEKEINKFLGIIDDTYKNLKSTIKDERTAINKAILAAGFLYFYNDVLSDQDLVNYIAYVQSEAIKKVKEDTSENIVSVFLDGMADMFTKKELLEGEHYVITYHNDRKLMSFKFREVFKLFQDNMRNSNNPMMKSSTIKKYLQKEIFHVAPQEGVLSDRVVVNKVRSSVIHIDVMKTENVSADFCDAFNYETEY